MTLQKCDRHRTATEFRTFLIEDLPQYNMEFKSFSFEKDQLDQFHFGTLPITKCNLMSFVIKLLLTLSHGQADIERGFSNYNNILKTTINAETVTDKRLIKDRMVANQLKLHTKLPLEKEKNKTVLSDQKRQGVHISNDIKKFYIK